MTNDRRLGTSAAECAERLNEQQQHNSNNNSNTLNNNNNSNSIMLSPLFFINNDCVPLIAANCG